MLDSILIYTFFQIDPHWKADTLKKYLIIALTD